MLTCPNCGLTLAAPEGKAGDSADFMAWANKTMDDAGLRFTDPAEANALQRSIARALIAAYWQGREDHAAERSDRRGSGT